jgi:hypothetical protein
MKKIFLFLLVLHFYVFGFAQVSSYSTSGVDFKFSGVLLEDSFSFSQVPRMSLWLNLSEYYHFDFNPFLGSFVGFGIDNIGYIVEYNAPYNVKVKYRSYMVSMPIGLKVGDLERKNPTYFYFGGGFSVPFLFKEKIFDGKKKTLVFKEWFSSRTNFLQPSVFLGYTFPNGMSLKVQYYFENFMNSDFKTEVNNVTSQPYKHIIKSNLIAVTLGGSFTHLKKKN